MISIHALCEEGDRTWTWTSWATTYFYPRPLRGGRRPKRSLPHGRPADFYPRPLRGGRLHIQITKSGFVPFLSTPSARRATPLFHLSALRGSYFYPRPLRGGRHCRDCQRNHTWRFLSTPSARRATQAGEVHRYGRPISIHALCEEGDGFGGDFEPRAGRFLSTPSARRATAQTKLDIAKQAQFLSTPSARRATASEEEESARPCNFYPRPLRGGRPAVRVRTGRAVRISIHALCEEGDQLSGFFYDSHHKFLSTPSARRATCKRKYDTPFNREFLSTPSARRATEQNLAEYLTEKISIHALCEEGDIGMVRWGSRETKFLSTPSARRATSSLMNASRVIVFLSTPSARRATRVSCDHWNAGAISIHALCEEGDFRVFNNAPIILVFLSTPSARRATCAGYRLEFKEDISIHALCEEGDGSSRRLCDPVEPFLSTPSARRATGLPQGMPQRGKKFLSTPSARRATLTAD